MYEWNGRKPLPMQIVKRPVWSERVKALRTMLLELPQPAKAAFGLLLLVLVVSLMGCATTSAPPTTTPRNPAPPPSALPQSPPDYLGDAQRFISESRRLLQELTTKPAN
jgi:hypothetical protein